MFVAEFVRLIHYHPDGERDTTAGLREQQPYLAKPVPRSEVEYAPPESRFLL